TEPRHEIAPLPAPVPGHAGPIPPDGHRHDGLALHYHGARPGEPAPAPEPAARPLDDQVADGIALLRSVPGLVREIQQLRSQRSPGPESPGQRAQDWTAKMERALGLEPGQARDPVQLLQFAVRLRNNERALIAENAACFGQIDRMKALLSALKDQAAQYQAH